MIYQETNLAGCLLVTPAPFVDERGFVAETGERSIANSDATYAILRTPWVVSGRGENFIKSMLRLSGTRNEMSIVADQIGAPTPARNIAEACYQIAKELIANSKKSGIYNRTRMPIVRW